RRGGSPPYGSQLPLCLSVEQCSRSPSHRIETRCRGGDRSGGIPPTVRQRHTAGGCPPQPPQLRLYFLVLCREECCCVNHRAFCSNARDSKWTSRHHDSYSRP